MAARGAARAGFGSTLRAAGLRVIGAMLALLLLATTSTWADSMSVVTSQSAQGPNDTVSWSRLGGNATVLGQSFNTSSASGTSVGVSLNGPNSLLAVVCPASTCSWAGAGISAGDTLLWTSNGNNGGNGPITLSFNRGLAGVGALIQADGSAQFTASIQAFNGSTSLGTFTETSNSTGTAVYLGVIDRSGSNITSVTFSLTSALGVTSDFAIDTLNLGSSFVSPPPATPTLTITPTPVRTSTPVPTATATFTVIPTKAPVQAPTSTPTPAPQPPSSSGGSITFVGTSPISDNSSAVSTVAIGLPLGVQSGDVLIAQIVVYDGTASDVPTAPKGWTAIRDDAVNSGDKATSWLYYHIAGSNEPAFYSWSIVPNWAAGAMGAWRGASNTPIDKTSGATAAGTSFSLAAPSLTPAQNNEQQIYFYGAQSGSAPTISVANGLNLRFDQRSSKEGFTLAFADVAAPSAGNPSPTYAATSGNAAMTAQAILLLPSSAGANNAPAPPPAPTVTPTPVPAPSGGSISYVGAGALTDFSSPTSLVTLAVPSGIQSGDTLVAQILVYDGTGSDTLSAPGGWNSIRHDSISDGNQITSWLYYKVAGSNEPASYAWTLSSNWAAGAMGAWRGASSSPIDKSSGAGATGTSPVSESAPSLTPSGNGELQVYFYGSQSASAPSLTLSGALNRRFDVESAKEGFSLAFGDVAAPGAGTPSATYSATASIGGGAAITAQGILLH
jgi:hypothetical protein